MSESQLGVFLLASLVLILTPGQDMILVMSRSVAQGAKAGLATAAGVSTGLLGHTLFAALGLGTLLRASAGVFVTIKLAGALYLIYLGIGLLRSRPKGFEVAVSGDRPLRKLFLQGALSNLANPKITIFYCAFLPQFVPAGAASAHLLLLLLGAAFAVLTFLVKAPIGYGAGTLSGWLRCRPGIEVWMNRCSGIVLIGLGVRLAIQKRA